MAYRIAVLEVGTGSGYQAAILSQLVPKVYSVERIVALQTQARERYHSWAYTIFHSSIPMVPGAGLSMRLIKRLLSPLHLKKCHRSLLEQLDIGGMMVIPVAVSRAYRNCY